jgi:uncharacterized protein YjiS (DUF1127 family)
MPAIPLKLDRPTSGLDLRPTWGRQLAQNNERGGLIALIDVWLRRARDRRALWSENDRSLRDMGLTRYDALYEARKPFWRA